MRAVSNHDHRGDIVVIGGCSALAAGARCLGPAFLSGEERPSFDVLIPLTVLGREHQLIQDAEAMAKKGQVLILPKYLKDFGGVPSDWSQFVHMLAGKMQQGQRPLIFCQAGHGRTGTLLASLIAVMEEQIDDPVEAVRNRYCLMAVESRAQARAIFALKGRSVKADYRCAVGPALI